MTEARRAIEDKLKELDDEKERVEKELRLVEQSRKEFKARLREIGNDEKAKEVEGWEMIERDELKAALKSVEGKKENLKIELKKLEKGEMKLAGELDEELGKEFGDE